MTDAERLTLESEYRASMPATINEDTDEGYIYGCLSDNTSSVDACVPSCIRGYKYIGMATCSNRVYTKKAGALSLINDIKSETAYVYLEMGEKLSTSDMKLLHNKHNIKEVHIFTRKPNSRDYEHTTTKELVSKKTRPVKTKKSRSGLALIAGVILIILIILLIIYLIYTCNM
jgi:hypothetical protein